MRNRLSVGVLSSAFLTLLIFGESTVAQDTDSGIAKQAVSLLIESQTLHTGSIPRYARDRQILPLSSPILFPNSLSNSTEFQHAMAQLDNVPNNSDGYIVLGETMIPSALKSLEGSIIVALPETSNEEEELVKQARKLLFDEKGLPTPGYATYLSYEEQYNKQIGALKSETDLDLLQQRRAALATLEREWEVLGARSVFASAIRQYEKANSSGGRERLSQWLSLLVPLNLEQALKSALTSSNWIRISSSKSPSSSVVSVSVPDKATQLQGMRRLSFDGTVLWLDKPYLTDGFFLGRGWKLDAAQPVSIGEGANIGNSLVPMVITGLLVAKNVEIQLEADMDSKLQDVLSSETTVEVGGIRFGARYKNPLVVQSSMLGMPGPILFGVVVDYLGKLPDPDPDRRWPQ